MKSCALRARSHGSSSHQIRSGLGATLVLGLALLLVNLAGIAAAIMPFLTLTVAYTFLADAHFVLPPLTLEGVGSAA